MDETQQRTVEELSETIRESIHELGYIQTDMQRLLKKLEGCYKHIFTLQEKL